MLQFACLGIVLMTLASVWASGMQVPVEPGISNLLNSIELRDLAKSKDIPSRARVYLRAGERLLGSAEESLRTDQITDFLRFLDHYRQILMECRREVEMATTSKKPDLKRQEITLRRFLSRLDSLQSQAGMDEQDQILSSVRITRELRNLFLQTFFGHDALKKP